MDSKSIKDLCKLACKIRIGVLESVFSAQSGHPGGSLSIADLLAYLYSTELEVDPKNPKDPNRDRLVLSKGHAAPALYSILAHMGFFELDDLKTLRKLGSHLQGHPNMKSTPGVDMTTGSLGQGISAACGMALGAKLNNSGSRIYCILGDGEIEEGQVWEASMFASHYNLDNLCLFIDNNSLQIDGSVQEVAGLSNIPEKFNSFGFNVLEINGHDFEQIDSAVNQAKNCKSKPSAIIMKTNKGKCVSYMENNVSWHGAAPNKEQFDIAKKELLNALSRLED